MPNPNKYRATKRDILELVTGDAEEFLDDVGEHTWGIRNSRGVPPHNIIEDAVRDGTVTVEELVSAFRAGLDYLQPPTHTHEG